MDQAGMVHIRRSIPHEVLKKQGLLNGQRFEFYGGD
jgi:hypothetical protein